MKTNTIITNPKINFVDNKDGSIKQIIIKGEFCEDSLIEAIQDLLLQDRRFFSLRSGGTVEIQVLNLETYFEELIFTFDILSDIL